MALLAIMPEAAQGSGYDSKPQEREGHLLTNLLDHEVLVNK